MWAWLTEPLSLTIHQKTLLACLLIGFTNGFTSAFIVLRKSALKVGSLSHTLLPGIALAILVTGGLTWTNAFLGALFAALLVGLGSLAVERSSRLDQETALAVFYTAAFSGGIVMLNSMQVPQALEHWLFGNISLVADADLWIAYGISVVALLALTLLQRPITIMLFEPNVAASLGVPVRWLSFLLFALVIIVLISSLQAVGCILALGLLVAPAAIVYFFTDHTQALFWLGGLVGAAGASSSVFLAYWIGWPHGPTIVLVLGGWFVLAYLLSPKYGLWKRFLAPRHRHGGKVVSQ
ncbi:MAG: metal ABC transporter permease [Verrucomicrobiota bacterium]